MSDITPEMLKEMQESSAFMHKTYESRQQDYKPFQETKELEAKLTEAMSVNKLQVNDWTAGPRNFYDHTKNSETKLNFMGQHGLMTTGEYREKFQGRDAHETMKANDAAFRAMFLAHKTEQAEVWDSKEREQLMKQHQVERSYLEYRMGKDEGTLNPRQEEAKKAELLQAYKSFQPQHSSNQEIAPEAQQYADKLNKSLVENRIQSLRQKHGMSMKMGA